MNEEETDIITGKYGDLWMHFIKENRPERYRHFIRLGGIAAVMPQMNQQMQKSKYSSSNGNLEKNVDESKVDITKSETAVEENEFVDFNMF